MLAEGFLDRMQAARIGLGQTLNRPELVPVRLHGEDDARADGFSVEQDSARPHTPCSQPRWSPVRPDSRRASASVQCPGYVERCLFAVEPAPHG
jgi:hypothetical protein